MGWLILNVVHEVWWWWWVCVHQISHYWISGELKRRKKRRGETVVVTL